MTQYGSAPAGDNTAKGDLTIFWELFTPIPRAPKHLKMTVPLVSHIGNSLRFAIVPVVKIFEKKWGHRENLGESGGQIFKGSDREKFSTLATSNIRLLLLFGEEDQ